MAYLQLTRLDLDQYIPWDIYTLSSCNFHQVSFSYCHSNFLTCVRRMTISFHCTCISRGQGWRWALVVRMEWRHKVQKFSSGTGSPGWSWKKGRETVVVVHLYFQSKRFQRYIRKAVVHAWLTTYYITRSIDCSFACLTFTASVIAVKICSFH